MKDEPSQGVRAAPNRCITDAAKTEGEPSLLEELMVEIEGDHEATPAERKLVAEVRRLQSVVADQALTIGTLKDEIARMRDVVSKEQEAAQDAYDAGLAVANKLKAELEQMKARAHDFAHEMGQHKLDAWKLRQDLKAACDNAIEFKNGKDEMRLQRDENFEALERLRAELKSVRDEHHDVMVRLRLEPPKGEPYNGY